MRSRWLDSVLRGLASTPIHQGPLPPAQQAYSDVTRFWELVRLVRLDIQYGCASERAKADARELFRLAERKREARQSDGAHSEG